MNIKRVTITVHSNHLIKRQKTEEALSNYLSITKADPGNLKAWKDAGYCYRMLKRYDKALEAYQKVIAGNNRALAASAYIGMGKIYEDTGQIEQAFKAYDESAKIYRHNCDACLGIARLYAKTDNRGMAIYWANEAVETNRHNWHAWLLLAKQYFAADQLENAKKAYQKVLEINPEIRDAHQGIKSVESRIKLQGKPNS